MNCLCCGRKIEGSRLRCEREHLWHTKCVNSFFGTKEMPVVDITGEKLEKLADETVNMGLTVTGVQKKLSLHLSKLPDARLTLVNYPMGYIMKPQTEEYENLPEYEAFAMRAAAAIGIKTVENALLYNNEQYSYITKRADRLLPSGEKLAMEDFCQLSERLTMDKYKGSYEKCAKIIDRYSVRPGIDKSEMFIRLAFSFIIGNSDMHLKNLSLIETEPRSRKYILSPAYDMLPVNIIIPEDNGQMALTLNGKRSNLKRRDFIEFAETCCINKKAAEKMLDGVCKQGTVIIKECDSSYLPEDKKENLAELINNRIKQMSQSNENDSAI